MKSLVIKNKGQKIVPLVIIVGLLSLPLLIWLFLRQEIQSAFIYCRETIVVQYGSHQLLFVSLAVLTMCLAISGINLVILWWREVAQTRAIRRWASLRLVASHEDITVVKASEPLAITIGYVRPTIIYSTGLIALLQEEELEAVLAHEIAHQTHRDPLRRLGLYSLMRFFWFWPALSGLTKYYVTQQEARADSVAAQSVGSAVVVSSMKKIVTTIVTLQRTSLSSCAFSFSPERLLAAQTGTGYYHFQFSIGELLGSSISLIIILFVVMFGTTAVQAQGEAVNHNLLCQYVAEHNVMVGFSPLLTQSTDNFEPAQDAYLVWRP